MGENDGCLLFDIGVYESCCFIRDNILVDILLLKELPENLADLSNDDLYPSDYKLNHRYPNKCYVTLSQTAGRKVSKCGYTFVEPIDVLNQYTYAVIRISNNSFMSKEYQIFIFPILVLLTKEHRGSTICFHFMYEGSFYKKMSAMIYSPTFFMPFRDEGWNIILYTDDDDKVSRNKCREYHLIHLQQNKVQKSYHTFLSMSDKIVLNGFDLTKMMI